MKKISLFTLALGLGAAVFAQDARPARTPMERKTTFGLDAGVNLATYNINAEKFRNPSLAPNTNMKTSFHVGAFVDIPVGAGMFSLKPQILYNRLGSKISQPVATGTSTTNVNYEEDLHYINVAPVALQLKTPGGFIVETGPQAGFLIKARQDGPAPYNRDNINVERKKLDVLWSSGIGYMSRIGLGVHARYNFGLSNVYHADNASDENGEAKNKFIQMGLMYHFGAHK